MTNKFIPPQTTTATRTAATPIPGELLFDTDTQSLYIGDGSTVGGVEVGSGGGGLTYSYQSTSFNAVTGNSYGVNTSSGIITATLPASPNDGDVVAFSDAGSNFGTNNLVIDGNGNNIAGFADITLTGNNESVQLRYSSDASQWMIEEKGTQSPITDYINNQREVLSADRTYYVRVDGNDNNNGLTNSNSGAFATIQKAVDVAASLDQSIHKVTVKVGAGTYTEAVTLKKVIGIAILEGDTTTPSNVVISTTSAHCISGHSILGNWTIKGFKLQTAIDGNCISLRNNNILTVENIEFGSAANRHIYITTDGICHIMSNYLISGTPSGGNHVLAEFGGKLICQGYTITISNNPAFSGTFGFAFAHWAGLIDYVNCTFSGSATGKYYLVEKGGYIRGTVNGNFPGNSSGTATSPGFYST